MNVNDLRFEEVQGDSVDGDFIKFDAIGQQSIGVLQRIVERDGKYGPETVLAFESIDGRDAFNITAPYDLKQKSAKLTAGHIVRITYVSEKAMGAGKNPMKVFKVETAPAPAPRRVVTSTSDVPF